MTLLPADVVATSATVAATRSLIEADVSRRKRKKVIDKMAAVFILQGFLDSKR